ncbi:Hypothetical predicted protein [Paramuricea clavata]|uniref:Mutator-like transposase domain-containing protein n=1 Tax=Paramuricea clavata TaxID=317549 RepID=A0A6S7HZY9_PARCT|nr:Hypothetical predicted protein [Paramuricea clavata]
MPDLTIKCNICSGSTSCETSLSVSERGKLYDVNRRAGYHSLETGSGYEGLVPLCSIMNMPCLSLPFYHKMVDTILVVVEAEAHEEMQLEGQKVQDFISKENREQVNDDTVVDTAVSFDKTWANGASSRLTIMDRLSISGGKFTKMSSAKKDKRRVKKADRQATEKEKMYRQAIKQRKVMREEASLEAEGVTYEAEGF